MISVAPTVVADANSLWNFAVVERLDIVESRIGHRIAWTDAAAFEIGQSQTYQPLLEQIDHCHWLGAPVVLADPKCVLEVARVQRALAGPDDGPSKHLGEAESIHYIEHELAGHGVLLTDDMPAADLAKHRGIPVMTTPSLLAAAHADGDLLCPEPFSLLVTMAEDHDRGVWGRPTTARSAKRATGSFAGQPASRQLQFAPRLTARLAFHAK